MENKLNIPIILGTQRPGSESSKVANLLLTQVSENTGVHTEIIDAHNHDLTDEQYRAKIAAADGLIIVSPEYNHSFPGSLKTLMDKAYVEYNHKAVGLVGVSSGPFGGARVIESLLPILRAFKLSCTTSDLNFGMVKEVFNENGELQDDKFIKRIEDFMKELLWLTKTLKEGRKNG